jgi:hypothetical protein
MKPMLSKFLVAAVVVPVLTWHYSDPTVKGFVMQSQAVTGGAWVIDATASTSDVCIFRVSAAATQPCTLRLACSWLLPDKNRFYRVCDGYECRTTAQITCECGTGTGCPDWLYPAPATCP